MTTTAFLRLQRVLELEEKQGWRNRAVVGGLQAMAERWQADAMSEAGATDTPATVDAVAWVVRLMGAYEGTEQAQRASVAHAILCCLEGNIGEAQAILGPETVEQGEPAGSAAGGEAGAQDQVQDKAARQPAIAEIEMPPPEPTYVAQERVQRRQSQAAAQTADLQASPDILPGVGRATAEQFGAPGHFDDHGSAVASAGAL